jgi:hypothetical protein
MGSEILFFELVCYQPHQRKRVLLIGVVREEESELVGFSTEFTAEFLPD